MLKLRVAILVLCCFVLTVLFPGGVVFADLFDGIQNKKETTLLAKKKKKKKRRKKRRRKKRSKRNKRKKRSRRGSRGSSKVFSKGFYGLFELAYNMPSEIDFMPVVEAGSSAGSMTNAVLTYTPGPGLGLGCGYKFIRYFATELDLFFIYPVVGSKLSLERTGNEGISSGAKFIMPRLLVKGFLPFDIFSPSMSSFEAYLGGGVGYTQLLKTVQPEDEGVALAGLSYHGVLGVRYALTSQFALGLNFEYASINYTYVDVWETAIYDSTQDGSVSVTQTVMKFGLQGTYKF